ncbi:hypothetical protein [Chryseobacterium indoltheticum]|uniref:Uncharacterized protein n=1 Tax=Chryseobacterium indoltheticum TaxID=254 RepID=A0A381FHU5_9FLAO|nr:hypothetical protein [Chryseobacterium indoltheticum]SUX45712.1 Uncharacterised protein [Chryseobacterium indoltheticum]
MKKNILLAAFGVAGLVSAKTSEIVEKVEIVNTDNSTKETVIGNCYTVTYVLSCGERILDSYCDSYDDIECDLMVIWDAWDNELC